MKVYVWSKVGGENVPHSRRTRGRRPDERENDEIRWEKVRLVKHVKIKIKKNTSDTSGGCSDDILTSRHFSLPSTYEKGAAAATQGACMHVDCYHEYESTPNARIVAHCRIYLTCNAAAAVRLRLAKARQKAEKEKLENESLVRL